MLTKSIYLAVFLFSISTAVNAQDLADRYDLSGYRVEAIHGDWRVLCTPEGTSNWGTSADCAVEDRNGLVVFVGPAGPYSVTLRGYRGDDGIFSGGFGACDLGVCATFWGGILVETFENDVELLRDGEIVALSIDGLTEAEADALERAQ